MRELATYIEEGFFTNIGHDEDIKHLQAIDKIKKLQREWLSSNVKHRNAKDFYSRLEMYLRDIPEDRGICLKSLGEYFYTYIKSDLVHDEFTYSNYGKSLKNKPTVHRCGIWSSLSDIGLLLFPDTDNKISTTIYSCGYDKNKKVVVDLEENLNEGFYKNVGTDLTDTIKKIFSEERIEAFCDGRYPGRYTSHDVTYDIIDDINKTFGDDFIMNIEAEYILGRSKTSIRIDRYRNGAGLEIKSSMTPQCKTVSQRLPSVIEKILISLHNSDIVNVTLESTK